MRSGRPRLQTILRLQCGSSRSTSARPRCAPSRTTRTATPSPATRTCRTTSHDRRRARRRVPRGARAGRARATRSRFRASGTRSLPLDEHERPVSPVLTWRDVDRRPAAHSIRRRTTARTGCFLHPSFWPAKLAGLTAARYVSFADYLLLRLDGRARHEHLDGERHRRLRSEPPRVGRRDARRRRRRRVAAPAGLGRAGRGRLAGARRRCVLERRCGLRRARPRGGDDRDVGGRARRLRARRRPSRSPGSSSTGSTTAASARAVRCRTAGTCTRGSSATLRECRADRPARPRPHVPAVSRRRALARLGRCTAAGSIDGPHVRDDAGRDRRRPRSKASRTGWPTCSTRSAGSSRSSRPGTPLLVERRLAADPRRRARTAGRGLRRARRLGARRCGRRARAARGRRAAGPGRARRRAAAGAFRDPFGGEGRTTETDAFTGGEMIGIIGGGLSAAKARRELPRGRRDGRHRPLVAGPARAVPPPAAHEAAAARRVEAGGRADLARGRRRAAGRAHRVAGRGRGGHDRARDRRDAAQARRRARVPHARRLRSSFAAEPSRRRPRP